MAGPGDLDGDGFADIAVGARNADANGEDSGAVYLRQGSSSGINGVSAAAMVRISGENAGDHAGAVSQVGDVNGDGYADLLVGAPNAGSLAGRAYVLFGAPTLNDSSLADAAIRLDGENSGDEAGITLSGGNDLDGDSTPDLVVSAWRYDHDGSDTGATYIWTDPSVGVHSLGDSAAIIFGETGRLAVDGSSVGDVNDDGWNDVVVIGSNVLGVFFITP